MAIPQVLISADSHVSEAGDLWTTRVPAKFRDAAPTFPDRRDRAGTGRFEEKTGGYDPNERLKEMATDGVSAEVLYPTLGLRLFGLDDAELQEACFRAYNDWIIEYCSVAPDRLVGVGCIPVYDPNERLKEMATDGVSAEVLYPTLGLRLFGLDDAELQEACFRAYNDWIIEYCSVAPDRLVGVGCIPVYDIDRGIAELERCKKNDLRGGLIWQAPHPDLPFTSDHYERFWAAAQDLEMPINLHILTGHNYSKGGPGTRTGPESYRGSVNLKAFDAINAIFELIFYGVLDRFPRLKIVIVENEIGWIPFFLQQWDYYYRRFHETNPPPINKNPSEYFYRQIYATFFDDAVGGHNLSWWGQDNCMWSNDYPHPNSTWPHSRDVIERDLGHLPFEVQTKIVCDNVAALYGLKVPTPV